MQRQVPCTSGNSHTDQNRQTQLFGNKICGGLQRAKDPRWECCHLYSHLRSGGGKVDGAKLKCCKSFLLFHLFISSSCLGICSCAVCKLLTIFYSYYKVGSDCCQAFDISWVRYAIKAFYHFCQYHCYHCFLTWNVKLVEN